jgi:hypothetical protein
MLRLPPSLKWLLTRRGRVAGDIQRIENYFERHRRIFERFRELNDELSELKETLISIDQTLSLHEVQIDTSLIPLIRSKKHRINLPYGELTRLIYQRISLGNGQPVCTTEIVAFITQRYPILEEPNTKENQVPEAKIRRRVQARLKNLCQIGKVTRHHSPLTTQYGRWSLSSQFIQDIQMSADDLEHTL